MRFDRLTFSEISPIGIAESYCALEGGEWWIEMGFARMTLMSPRESSLNDFGLLIAYVSLCSGWGIRHAVPPTWTFGQFADEVEILPSRQKVGVAVPSPSRKPADQTYRSPSRSLSRTRFRR